MMNFIYEGIKKVANWKGLLVFGVVLAILMVLMLGKPLGIAQIKEVSGGVSVIDSEFNYSPEQAYEIIDKLGDNGRPLALTLVLLDFVFLIFYAYFWAALLMIIYRKWLPEGSPWQKIALLPVLAAIADCFENILLAIMLAYCYTQKFFGMAAVANVMTMLKWSLVGLSLTVTIIGAIGVVIKSISGKTKPSVKSGV